MRIELYETVRYGKETISSLFPKMLSLIPKDMKDSGSLPCFKQKKHLKMETQLPMSFMQNIFATCWFYIAQQ